MHKTSRQEKAWGRKKGRGGRGKERNKVEWKRITARTGGKQKDRKGPFWDT